MNIYLPKKLKGIDILTYSYIQAMSALTPFDDAMFTITMLAKRMGHTDNRFKTELSNSVKHLIELGYMSGEYDKSLWCVTLTHIENNFVLIDFDDIVKILQNGRIEMLDYYVTLVGTISSNRKCGIYPMKYIADTYDFSYNTILKYNKILEDMKLIYICHNASSSRNTNTYGLYKDKDEIEDYNVSKCNMFVV